MGLQYLRIADPACPVVPVIVFSTAAGLCAIPHTSPSTCLCLLSWHALPQEELPMSSSAATLGAWSYILAPQVCCLWLQIGMPLPIVG